jgi:glycosyl transferase family 25
MKAFVVSLKSATARRQAIAAMLDFNMPYEIVDAVPGREIEPHAHIYAGDLYCPRYKRALRPNEIACSLSHRAALRRFLDSGAYYGLILEDDAQITPKQIRDIYSAVDACGKFDVLKIGGEGEDSRIGVVTGQTGAISIIAIKKPSMCAHAYVVKREGAEKLIGALLPINEPFDSYLRNVAVHKCNVFETAPFLASVSSHGEDSTIGDGRTAIQHAESFVRLARSALFQLRSKLGMVAFNLRRFGLAYVTKNGFVTIPGENARQ